MRRIMMLIVVVAMLGACGCGRDFFPPLPGPPPTRPPANRMPAGSPGMLPVMRDPHVGGAPGRFEVGVPGMEFFVESRKQLGLTKEQQAKLLGLLRKKQTFIQLRDAAMVSAAELHDAMILDKVYDQKKIDTLIAELSKAQAALLQDSAQTWRSVRSILTAAQMNKVGELLERPLRPPLGMGPGGPMGPGRMPGPPGMPGGPMGPGGMPGPGGRGPGGRR